MLKGEWYALNWYLLHHPDVDLKTAYELWQSNNTEYKNWIDEHSINALEPKKNVEEILLAYITDYINDNDADDDSSIKERINQLEQGHEAEQDSIAQETKSILAAEMVIAQQIKISSGSKKAALEIKLEKLRAKKRELLNQLNKD